jgi:excisionase family DNA binding protein
MLMTDYHNEDTEAKKHALEDYMTIAQAIRQSGYTDQYLRRMAKEGRIYALKVGQFWLISRRSLQAFMDHANTKGEQDSRYGPKKSR